MSRFHSILAIFLSLCTLTITVQGIGINPIPQQGANQILFDNQPPAVPNITGPHVGAPGFELTYTATTVDPDGDQIYFKMDWGDGNLTDWLGPVNSTETIVTHHAWVNDGNYTMYIQVKDSQGLVQNQTLLYAISIAPQLTLTNLIPGYVYFGKTYFFVAMFEVIGAVLLTTVDNILQLNFTTAPNVAKVIVVATHYKTSTNTNVTDDNATDGFSIKVPILSGIYQIGYLAYDAQGNEIDGNILNFLIYLQFGTMKMNTHLAGRSME
jgi:hypothetical protein